MISHIIAFIAGIWFAGAAFAALMLPDDHEDGTPISALEKIVSVVLWPLFMGVERVD